MNAVAITDTNNIHGWLQEKIHSAEGRMAAWTSKIIENDKDSLSKIENIFSIKEFKSNFSN